MEKDVLDFRVKVMESVAAVCVGHPEIFAGLFAEILFIVEHGPEAPKPKPKGEEDCR
ncbi:hypothetical protein [Rhodospirillum sp. A1_3_36]|uniref:hypothetical protein n=1 Tax=Rhodospirillum sp. A1_3_36 TaxID=3391666 RepID=UPI0039A5D5E9